MKLPHYNGESPLETYRIQVQLAVRFNAWSAEETGVQVALTLEGKALQVLNDLKSAYSRPTGQPLSGALQRRRVPDLVMPDQGPLLAVALPHRPGFDRSGLIHSSAHPLLGRGLRYGHTGVGFQS